MLQKIQHGLMNPVWPLFLGRKAFVPSQPVFLLDGLRLEEDLKYALEHYPRLVHGTEKILRLLIEDDKGADIRPDQPITFQPRKFIQRRVSTQWVTPPDIVVEEAEKCTSPG